MERTCKGGIMKSNKKIHPYLYTFYWDENYGYDTWMMDKVMFAQSEGEARAMAQKYADENECDYFRRSNYPIKIGEMRYHHSSYYD